MFAQERILTPCLDYLMGTLYRLRTARTIPHALKQLVSPSLVNALSEEISAVDLIEHVAIKLETQATALLDSVANRLELACAIAIKVPSPKLVENTGYSAKQLQLFDVIPQESETASRGYFFVCSDPTKINIKEFRRCGIAVILGLGKPIRQAWQRFDVLQSAESETLTEQQVLSVLQQLALDGAKKGTSVIYVGSPDIKSYEFQVQDKRFAGRLHPKIMTNLLGMLRDSPTLSLPINQHGLDAIRLRPEMNGKNHVVTMLLEYSSPKILPSRSTISHISSRPTGLDIATQPNNTELRETKISTLNGNSHSGRNVNHTHQSTSQLQANECILLIDDDPRFLFILKKMLESKGWNIVTQANAQTALEMIYRSELSPRLIVSDVHMPGMDGVTFLRRLRETVQDIPVLMLTSDDDSLLEAEVALLNADALIRKQEHPKVLLAWCLNLINRDRRRTINAGD